MFFLKFLLAIFIFIVVLFLIVGSSFFRMISRASRKMDSSSSHKHTQRKNKNTHQDQASASSQDRKVISKDEGEYIDYEEIED
jgi:hypothetical protein